MLRLKDRKQSWQTGKEPAKPSASALEHAARLAVQRDREKRAADGMPPPPQGLVDLLNMGFKSPGKSRRRG
jgi:hypothetical protein